MAWVVHWTVVLDGMDISAAMASYLIDIEVTDKEGTASDSCTLTLDDTEGQLRLPKDGGSIVVSLMGVPVFQGTVDSVRSSGSRGGGRLLKVSAKGFDSRGKVKEGQSFHKDDASLEEFLSQAAKAAGLTLVVDKELGDIRRDYWASESESFLGLGQRLAREVHGTFKIRGKQAVLVKRGNNPLAAVIATVGPDANVISWDIAPFTGRHTFTKAKVQWFDRKEAKFKTEEVEIDTGRELPDATNVIRSNAADKEQAKGIADGRKGEAEREGGDGTIVLDMTPGAQAEAVLVLIGARAGIDGTYRIVAVTHRASRSGGSTTSLELKQPGGGAGTDKR